MSYPKKHERGFIKLALSTLLCTLSTVFAAAGCASGIETDNSQSDSTAPESTSRAQQAATICTSGRALMASTKARMWLC